MAADWSRSETISSPDEIVIEYSITNAQGQSEKKEVVLISTPRSLNTVYHAPITYTDAEGKQQTREVITRKVDEKRTTVAAVNPAYIVWRLSQGLGLPVGDVFNITETTYEYVVSTEGPRVVREQVSDYMTEWQLAGSLAIEKYNNYEPTADRFECNRTVTFYDEWTGPYGRAVTRRRISRWASLGLSQEGSQAVQRKLKSIKSFLSAAQDLTGANLEAVVNSSKRLIFEGTEVQIETGKLPVPEMPSAADRVADEIVNGSDTTDTDGNGIPDWAQYDPADPFDVDNNGDGISDWVDLESLYEPDDNERRTNNDFTFDDQVSQQALDFDPATGLPIDPISGLPVKAIGNFEIKPVGDFQVDQSGRLINPVTGQPYNPPITVALDPVTGQPADPNVGFAINPATGQPYNPPITVALDPVTGRPIDTGLGLLINPATGDIFNPPRFTRVDPDSGLPIFAGDSVTATYEMPFAPDDTIEFVNGVRTLVPGGSEDAAELFGEVEAALDYGHAYGQNIVTAFGEMPTLTLAPIYVQLAGVEGAFLMDSVTYAWGSDGMVVSSDLMLLGVTGRYGNTTPSASWLRVPVPVASLRQINTAGTIEASPQKANTIAIPGGFDARNPAATLAALPTNGTDVFREWRDGDQLTQPVIKIKRSKLFTKPTLKVREFSYSLIPSSESAVLMTQPVLDFVWMIGVAPPSAAVAVAAFAPSIRTGASVKPPAAVVSVAGRAPIVSNATVVAVPAALIAVAGRAPDQVGRPRTEINAPSAVVALAASAPVVAIEVNVIVPAAAVAVAGVVPTMQVGGNVIQGLSPLLWYDFADESTVTVINGRINAINSKGTNPLALTRPGSVPAQSVPNYETGINGLKCADFGVDFHNSALTNTSTASLSIAEVYIVLTCIGATFVTNPFATSPTGLLADLDTGASTLRWYARGRQNTSSMNVVSTGHMLNEVFVNGAVTASAVVLPTINNPGLLRLKNTNNAVSINTKGLQFGNEGDRNSKGWRGLVGEVIAFSSVLSDSDRLALQQFLKTKWNLPLP